jgi:hypothetical protein
MAFFEWMIYHERVRKMIFSILLHFWKFAKSLKWLLLLFYGLFWMNDYIQMCLESNLAQKSKSWKSPKNEFVYFVLIFESLQKSWNGCNSLSMAFFEWMNGYIQMCLESNLAQKSVLWKVQKMILYIFLIFETYQKSWNGCNSFSMAFFEWMIIEFGTKKYIMKKSEKRFFLFFLNFWMFAKILKWL